MIPDASASVPGSHAFPRTRGDDPWTAAVREFGDAFSPHPRG